ncbi:hypothetical protein RSAG8_06320, partial [Rhizoctonia solani AG-8 WAC10335]
MCQAITSGPSQPPNRHLSKAHKHFIPKIPKHIKQSGREGA